MKFSELYKKYNSMRKPSFSLNVGGNKLEIDESAKLLRAVCSLTSKQEAGYLNLEARVDANEKNGKAWLNAFQLGSSVSFSLGYEDKNTQVFKGFLYDIYWDDPLDGGTTGIEATFLDVRGRLMLSSTADSDTSRTLSTMVKDILDQSFCTQLASKRKIGNFPTDWNIPFHRGGRSDYDVVCGAASFLCYEFYAYGDELYFGSPRPESTAALEFDGPNGLMRLRRRRSLAGQCGAIAVSGADDKGERLYFRKARKKDSGFGVKNIGSALSSDIQLPEPAANTMAQVQYLAKARMEETQKRGGGILGWGMGIPELRPGRFIKVSGMSEPVNGTYYVHTVFHTLDDTGFSTDFEAED